MGLRDALKAAIGTELHGCAPRECNRATATIDGATVYATTVQLRPGSHRWADATNEATAVQREGRNAVASRSMVATGSATAVATKVPDRPYRLSRQEADDAHARAWDESACVRFTARAARLRRVGLSGQDAEDLAERLQLRDVEGDDRASCFECRHYRASRCLNHRTAGLGASELGRDLAAKLQRCPGFASPQAERGLIEQETCREEVTHD